MRLPIFPCCRKLMDIRREVRGLSADPRHGTKVLQHISQGGRWWWATEMVEVMHSFRKEVNKFHFGVVLSACQKGTAWSQALGALAETEKTTISASSVISACREAGHWNLALCLVSKMHSMRLQPSLVSLNAATSACEKTGLWRSAFWLLNSKVKTWSLKADTITYNAALSACEKAADWTAALELLSMMCFRSTKRSKISFGAVVSACEKAEQWPWATELLLSIMAENLQPHLRLCNGLLSAFGKGLQWQSSLGLVGRLQEFTLQPDTITFNAAIYACEQTQWLSSLSLLRSMACSRTRPSDITYNAAAASLAGHWLAALQCLTDMHVARLTVDALTQSAVIQACTSAQQGEIAIDMLTHMSHAWMSRMRWGEKGLVSNMCCTERLRHSVRSCGKSRPGDGIP